MPQQPAQTWQLMVDLGVDIVNVDSVVAFRSFVVSNLYQRRWRRTLGPFGLDPGVQYLQQRNEYYSPSFLLTLLSLRFCIACPDNEETTPPAGVCCTEF